MVKCKQYHREGDCERCEVFKDRTVLACEGDMNKCEIEISRDMARAVERRRKERMRKKEKELANPVTIYAGTVNIDGAKLGSWGDMEDAKPTNTFKETIEKLQMKDFENQIIGGFFGAAKMVCERNLRGGKCKECPLFEVCNKTPSEIEDEEVLEAIAAMREAADEEIERVRKMMKEDD